MTRNGKVDRKKLEITEITTARARLESVDLNDDELEMAGLWCEVLQVRNYLSKLTVFTLRSH